MEIIGPKEGKVGDAITLVCLAGPANPSAEVYWSIDGQNSFVVILYIKNIYLCFELKSILQFNKPLILCDSSEDQFNDGFFHMNYNSFQLIIDSESKANHLLSI